MQRFKAIVAQYEQDKAHQIGKRVANQFQKWFMTLSSGVDSLPVYLYLSLIPVRASAVKIGPKKSIDLLWPRTAVLYVYM